MEKRWPFQQQNNFVTWLEGSENWKLEDSRWKLQILYEYGHRGIYEH